MKSINEHYQSVNEDMRFEALQMLREIQSNLVAISFLPVIAIMKSENPLKKDVLKFQDDLDTVTMDIQNFISSAKNDLDFEPAEGGEDEGTDEPQEQEDDKAEDKKDEVEDSSEPKEK